MTSTSSRRLGILAAMHDELAGLLAAMAPGVQVRTIGLRDYHVGELFGQPCVLVLARIGKVAAAATTVTLIREFGVDKVIFTGLAGGVGDGVCIGDVVVADALMQHDLDASPLFAPHEVPLLGLARFPADKTMRDVLRDSAQAYLHDDLPREMAATVRQQFGIEQPAVRMGLIASGDVFVHQPGVAASLAERLSGLLCVEMEGAAVAQICHEYGVACAVLRTISDRADGTAYVDFSAFLARVASVYAVGILRHALPRLA